MLGSGPPALDLPALLQFVLTALALLFGALLLVRKAASRYFVVDAAFDSGEAYDARMSIGGSSSGGDAAESGVCAACRAPTTMKCSRCKNVRYCSRACQTKHWEGHKLNCKQAILSDKENIVSSDNVCRRKKSSGFSAISLVPARGSCKVLQEPRRLLFSYEEFVKLFNWDKLGFLPCGLLNCGNSCFANVVLQCLGSTRPLVAYLLERDHSRGCIRKQSDWCFLCELQVHIRRASESLHPFSPMNILSRLPNIGGNLGYGRQEDAHEFMRFAIDTMQSVCLDAFGGEKALDPSTQETTLIQYIFGGHLRSQVICTKCNLLSNRYENMMDLTVEIQGDAESLEECLDQFTIKEWLDGDNMYKCDGCNDYVKAWKRLTVHQAPNILTIALKRFQSGRFGKLNKRITFPENLDLTPYMSGNGDGTDLYTLYAVVVHVDMLNASFFGHYICYTKDYQGNWYRIDDSKVMNVEVEEVLSQGAYMLFYSRRAARREPFIKPVEPAEKKHVLEIPMATEDSKARPVGMSLCSRDTGYERILSIESNTMKERELKPMLLTKSSRDVGMDDSEPIISAYVPEDVSSVRPLQSDSIYSVEDSSIEVQTIEVQAMDSEPCFSFDSVICMEQNTGSNSIAVDAKKSSSVSEPPCITSDVDICMEGDPGQNSILSVESNTMKVKELDNLDLDISSGIKPMPLTRSSRDVGMDDSEPIISAYVREDVSSVRPLQSDYISPVEDSSSNEVQAMDLEPCFSSDSVICMEQNNGSNSITVEAKTSSSVSEPPCITSDVDICMEGDPGQNSTAEETEVSFSSKNCVSIMAETSSSAPITATSSVPEPPDGSSPTGDEDRINHASKVNGYINGHVKLDFDGSCEPGFIGNGSSLLRLNGEDVLPRSGSSFMAPGFLNKTSTEGYIACEPGFNGHVKFDFDGSSEKPGFMVNDSSLLSLNGDVLSRSGSSFLAPGFLNKSYKTPTEGNIAKQLNRTDYPCQMNGNGSSLLSLNGDDVLPRSGSSFIAPGFLNKSYKTSTEGNIAKELNRTDYPCEMNGNGSSLLGLNGDDVLPQSGSSFIAPGFLNKSYKTSTKGNIIKELNRTDYPCQMNGNGSSLLSLNGDDVLPQSGSSFMVMAPGFMNKSYKTSIKGNIAKELNETDYPCKMNGNDSSRLSLNSDDILPPSGSSFMAPGFLNESYKTLSEGNIIKELNRTDYPCKMNDNGFAVLESSEQRLPGNDYGLESHYGNGKVIRPRPAFIPYMSPGFLNKSYTKNMKVDRQD